MTSAAGTGVVGWLFRNRRTGEITIAQLPNAPLIVFLVARVVRWVADPSGDVGRVVDLVGTVALVVWALDELLRGVNPWRRMLGAGVLGWQLVALIDR